MMTGEIREISLESERDFQWKISNFTSTLDEDCFCSPPFSFAGECWYLNIRNSDGYIDLYLYCHYHIDPISVEFSFTIKTVDEKTDMVRHYSHVFEEAEEGHGGVVISEILERKSEFLPNDVLTIVCTMKYIESGDISNIQTDMCSYCEKISSVEVISSHEKKCLDKPIKCPECFELIKLRSWYKHVCQIEKETVIGDMLNYFKDTIFSGEHSDVLIQVKEAEFRLHRIILAARNPFFSAMFKNNMKEKATGIVSIDDCEPEVFRQFVHFLYTGEVVDMSQENICSLYEAADKYQDQQLKRKCLSFMIKAISVEYFCEFITLALKFGEKELFEKAIEFFTSKVKDIVRHTKWQIFLKEYPTKANELLIKFLDNYVK